MKRFFFALLILALASLACGQGAPGTPFPALESSALSEEGTAYGFYPSPPQATLEAVIKHYTELGKYADFILFQNNVPWEEFVNAVDGDGKIRVDNINQAKLARQNGMDYVFVVDGLNGLNRREFFHLPAGWDANFANPNVRAAYKNYTLWVVREFHPRYLGLASEINTYMDAYPDDAQNFISLYNEIYGAVKSEAPETQIFVSFQWDDLNNMFPQPEEGNRQKLSPNWDQIEAFEPNLDLWVISSYPYFVFPSGAEIPADYYSRLLTRTSKRVAVAEGGYTSVSFGSVTATPADQVAYLNAIHDQLGSRLRFWVYLLLNDFDLESYGKVFKEQGSSDADIQSLAMFSTLGLREWDGTPKPALEVWMSYRDD